MVRIIGTGIAVKADFNIIDFDRLNAPKPFMVNDLPTGAPRLMATAEGYVKTLVSGEIVQENGKETGVRPGKLIRGKAAA